MSQDEKDLGGAGATPSAEEVPAGGTPLTPEPDHTAGPDAADAESHVDGCDVPISDADATPDDELPMTEGGVA